MAMTISMSVGRVAVMHDVRREISANIDQELMHRNEMIIDKLKDYGYSVEAYTNAKFQPYIDDYNATQTREERKKNMPYTELLAKENEKLIQKEKENKAKGIKKSVRKPTKLCHEYVLQIGDRATNGTLTADLEKNKEYAREIIKGIQEKYPHVDILLATFHADEPNGSMHTHLLVQFDGEGYKQGLKRQISMSKALELDGFERSGNRGDYAINRWCEDVKDTIMTEKLKEVMHEDRDVIGEHRKHEDIVIFREKAKAEERIKDQIQKEIETLKFAKEALEEYDIPSLKEELSCLEGKISSATSKLAQIKADGQKGLGYLSQLEKLQNEANTRLKTAQQMIDEELVRLQELINRSDAIENGLNASREVESILADVQMLADTLKNDYALAEIARRRERNTTLRERINGADKAHREHRTYGAEKAPKKRDFEH